MIPASIVVEKYRESFGSKSKSVLAIPSQSSDSVYSVSEHVFGLMQYNEQIKVIVFVCQNTEEQGKIQSEQE